jgi:hypothetical protein
MGIVAFISGKRYELGVALSPPLGCEKVIVPAARGVGIASAEPRSRVIDCALAFLCVEKLTDFPEDVVLLMTKYEANGRSLCVPPLRLLVRNTKVVRDS